MIEALVRFRDVLAGVVCFAFFLLVLLVIAGVAGGLDSCCCGSGLTADDRVLRAIVTIIETPEADAVVDDDSCGRAGAVAKRRRIGCILIATLLDVLYHDAGGINGLQKHTKTILQGDQCRI